MSQRNQPIGIALVISHPIQHFCPQYESFAKVPGIRFRVFFASAMGFKPYHDKNFGTRVSWSNLNLDKFDHEFLNGDTVLETNSLLDADSLEKQLSDFQPDAVIVYGYFQRLQKRAKRWARNNNVSVVYISDTENRQHRSIVKRLLKFPILYLYFKSVDYFFTVGDANEQFYKFHGVKPCKFIRMHFPIDLGLYKDRLASKSIIRHQTRLKYNIGEAFTAAVVGKLVPWKNQVHIIKAMQLLELEGIIMHLFIIGSGETLEECRQEAEKLIRSKVHFTGFTQPDDLPDYYASSDVYIHPASIEPHSLAISEAIYMGCPVIVSDRCGSWGKNDDVQDGLNGFVYRFGDIKDLSEKIKRLYNDVELRTQFSEFSQRIGNAFQQRSHFEAINELKNNINGNPKRN